MSAADELLLGQYLIIYPLLAYIVLLACYSLIRHFGGYALRALRLIPLAAIDLSMLALSAAKRTLS